MRSWFRFSFARKTNYSRSKTLIGRFSLVTNSTIGNYTYIAFGCRINNAKIGNYCSIGPNVKIGLGSHPLNRVSTNPIFHDKNNPLSLQAEHYRKYKTHDLTTIGSDVWIGANVVILDGLIIGTGSVIGAGSIVTKDVKPYEVVAGVPARHIKPRFSKDVVQRISSIKWYDYDLIEASRMMQTINLNDGE